MTILKILVAPDPLLQRTAKPVEEITPEILAILDNMLETMYAAPGIGLAATQVGIDKRLVVMDLADTSEESKEEPAPMKFINPEITWLSEEEAILEEGCLSVPEFYEDVIRPARCKVKAINEEGEEFEIVGEGLLSACLQHEIDHLDGELFIDHLSRIKKAMIIKKLSKRKKQGRIKF
jgi:peptide deformylase